MERRIPDVAFHYIRAPLPMKLNYPKVPAPLGQPLRTGHSKTVSCDTLRAVWRALINSQEASRTLERFDHCVLAANFAMHVRK